MLVSAAVGGTAGVAAGALAGLEAEIALSGVDDSASPFEQADRTTAPATTGITTERVERKAVVNDGSMETAEGMEWNGAT